LSQAFNSLGTSIAPILGASFILSDKVKSKDEIASLGQAAKDTYLSAEAAAVQSTFLGKYNSVKHSIMQHDS
jgi:FHS family L-fucose permease-like MFS transporter